MDYMDRKKAYYNVKTPEELMIFMDKYIRYGIYGTDNKVYENYGTSVDSEFQLACQNRYALCDIERYLRYGYGTCWDQVELQRDWFARNNYEFKTIFIWFLFEEENNYITHAYLVYKDKIDNKYCYFEHADYNNRGIYKFDTYKEAIEYQKVKHIKFNESCGNSIDDEVLNHLAIYEFDTPDFGCDMNGYINHIIKSKVIYENNKYINI